MIKKEKGYIALTSVIIISAIALLLAISASLFGVSETDMAVQQKHSSQAFYLANLCAEHALMELKNELGYFGDETLGFEDGSCTVLPLEGNGNYDRIIKTTSSIYGQTRKIKIEINRVNPEIEISSWQEVVNF